MTKTVTKNSESRARRQLREQHARLSRAHPISAADRSRLVTEAIASGRIIRIAPGYPEGIGATSFERELAWTRPHLHILLDLQLAVKNSTVQFSWRVLERVYGDDADAMMALFANSGVCVSNGPQTVSELDFVNQGFTDRRVNARHPALGRTAA